jgi:hypothetical protein
MTLNQSFCLDGMTEWLRCLTRNQVGFPAQVQVLVPSNFFSPLFTFTPNKVFK